MTTSSSDVAVEEHFFLTQADKNKESEEQTFEGNDQSRPDARQWVADEEPSRLKTSVNAFTKIDANTTSYSINGVETNARIRKEQDDDLVLKKTKLKILR